MYVSGHCKKKPERKSKSATSGDERKSEPKSKAVRKDPSYVGTRFGVLRSTHKGLSVDFGVVPAS